MIVEGLKTAQLMPMRRGPRFLSPDEGIISFLSMATDKVTPVIVIAQSSLIPCSNEREVQS